MTVIDQENIVVRWWSYIWNKVTYFFQDMSDDSSDRSLEQQSQIQSSLQNFIEVISSDDIPDKPIDDDPLDPYVLLGCSATGKMKLRYVKKSQIDEPCPYC